ncbi:MAG: HAMP domain-containing protein, partial [Chloroflexi bacterium]
MLGELWGTGNLFRLALPDTFLGYFLLLIDIIFLAAILLHFSRKTSFNSIFEKWQWVLGLSLAGFITSQLLPIPLPFTNQSLTPFSVFPLLLAASFLNPLAVLIVGAATGLGQSLGQTNQLFDVFHFAFTGLLAALLLQQPFIGRLYHFLRHPIVSGSISMILPAFLLGLSTLVISEAGFSLAALDQSLYTSNNALLLFLFEGFINGVLVLIILKWLPNLRPRQTLIPSPTQRSLRRQLIGNFLAFSIFITIVVMAVVFNLSISVSRRLVLNQMAHNAAIASSELPDFQSELERLVDAFDNTTLFTSSNPVEAEVSLEQIYNSSLLYNQLIVVNKELTISAQYAPGEPEKLQLSEEEKLALNAVFTTNDRKIVTKNSSSVEGLSFIVPVMDDGETVVAVIGRVTQLSINNLIVGIQGVTTDGVGFIVNEEGQVIAHPDPTMLNAYWQDEENGRSLSIETNGIKNGAYQFYESKSNTRQLVYYLQEDHDHKWTVVVSTPYAVVLDLSLDIGRPLLIILLVVVIASFIQLTYQSQGITEPITEMVTASKTMAAGGNWTPSIHAQRDDEIGQLSQAFSQMQRSMKKRLNDLSLLLNVSSDVSTNIDL